MKKLLCLLLLLAACGKKEWPQPVLTDELIHINHLEAGMDGDCLLVSTQLGGNLVNLEYFLVEVEQDGCPTCPFTPSVTKKLYPYSDGVLRRENSFILSICQPFPARSLRVRLQADNTHGAVEPAVSKTITLPPQSGEN